MIRKIQNGSKRLEHTLLLSLLLSITTYRVSALEQQSFQPQMAALVGGAEAKSVSLGWKIKRFDRQHQKFANALGEVRLATKTFVRDCLEI
jgi:hypothetical protein